jgi:type I restriction-modification system DNA methylase subunit
MAGMNDIHSMNGAVDDSSLVNISQIAELSEVGLSAVSNWRKRFDDFPQPVDSVPGGRDLFRLQEVEEWLEERGRLSKAGRGKQHLFRASDCLRGEVGDLSMTETLGAALALVALGRRQGWVTAGPSDLQSLLSASAAFDHSLADAFGPLQAIDAEHAADALAHILEIDEDELPECFEWVLSRHNQQQGRMGVADSSEAQVALLLALTEGEGRVVYDPAVGSGGFLLAIANATVGDVELVGQEINLSTARISRQRFLVHDIPVSLAGGDTLAEDAWPGLKADLVVCDPPFGGRRVWPEGAEADRRWVLGAPPAATDFAWLQQAIHHLRPDGRAYVFLPTGSLFRSGRERDLRSRLLAAGVVEGVVGLPAGSAPGIGLPLVLWILRRPQGDSAKDPVLLVDALASEPISREQFVGTAIPRIAAVLRRWRQHGELSEEDRAVAAAVAAEELLEDGANLVPARWIHQGLTGAQRAEQRSELEKALGVSREARHRVQAELEVDLTEDLSAEWVTVERLVEDGFVELIGGASAKPDHELSVGVQLLRTRDISSRVEENVTPVYVAPENAARFNLTEPGDIVVSPASGTLRTFVDRQGGRALVRPLQALRLLRSFMNPEVVAAFLEAPRNGRFVTGSTYARVSLRDLELPLLNVRDSEKLAMALEELNEQERIAAKLASSAQVLRRALVGLAAPTGQVRKGV